tara:strand:+ start:2615 stop:2863 length:249 start_codon:yes stop_codon:yes gene_type:complete
MSEIKKLESEELYNLRAVVEEVNKVQLQIGGVEAHKHELLHTIVIKNSELRKLQAELKDKYGEVDIDLNTGTITTQEDDTEN